MTIKDIDWQQSAIKLNETGVLSWRKMAKVLDVPKSSLSDFLRNYEDFKMQGGMDEVPSLDKHDNSRILLISDMHIPFHHKNSIQFLQMLKDRYSPTRVICMGDMEDCHALSYHDSDPDLMSAGDELKALLPVVAQLHEMFPKMDILESNHGSLVYRKSKTHGIPRAYLKSYKEFLQVGDGWTWSDDLLIDLPDGQKVYMHHGKVSDVVKMSQTMGCSAVSGHFHEKFKVEYWGSPVGLFWGMSVGSLIDDEALAFNYNNVNLKRPIVGTGLIIDGVPILEAMPL